jgi:hypothetical protein
MSFLSPHQVLRSPLDPPEFRPSIVLKITKVTESHGQQRDYRLSPWQIEQERFTFIAG